MEKKVVKKKVQETKEIILDKKALEYAIRKMLFTSVSESKVLREKLSFNDHIKLCEWTTKLTYENLVLVYLGENPKSKLTEQDVGKIRDYEGKMKTGLKYGLAGLAGGHVMQRGIPGTTFGGIKAVGTKIPGVKGWAQPKMLKAVGAAMLALYLYRKASDPCFRKCLGTGTLGIMGKQHKICKYECAANAAKNVLAQIRSQKSACGRTNNPEKCLKQLAKLEITWAKRYQEQLAKLNNEKSKI
jgi:hypothetical protein